MSATVSMRLRHLMVKAVFHRDLAEVPGTVYACMTWDVAPLNSIGPMLGEPAFGGYARVPYPLTANNWMVTGYGEVANADTILFPVPTLDWGYLQGWALTDSPTVGHGYTLASGSLVTPIYVRKDYQQAIAPQGMVIGIYD